MLTDCSTRCAIAGVHGADVELSITDWNVDWHDSHSGPSFEGPPQLSQAARRDASATGGAGAGFASRVVLSATDSLRPQHSQKSPGVSGSGSQSHGSHEASHGHGLGGPAGSSQGACQPPDPCLSGKTCATSDLDGGPATSFVTHRMAGTENWRTDYVVVMKKAGVASASLLACDLRRVERASVTKLSARSANSRGRRSDRGVAAGVNLRGCLDPGSPR